MLKVLCSLGLHAWDGCICTRCSLVRDDEHAWEGCKCTKCSGTRDEGHRWSGCTCAVCGQVRDEEHAWEGCKCTRCSRTRDQDHSIAENGVCTKCGLIDWRGREYIVTKRPPEAHDAPGRYEAVLRLPGGVYRVEANLLEKPGWSWQPSLNSWICHGMKSQKIITWEWVVLLDNGTLAEHLMGSAESFEDLVRRQIIGV